MISFFGDYDTTETVVIPFNTFTSDDPSASSTITNLVAGDVEIHKDGGVTQRASDNGVTVTIDFDTPTGNHIVSIDLSDNSDAGFYAAGSRYQVRIEGTTVDGATINAWIGAFSVGCTLRPTTAGRTLDVAATGEAGVDLGNVTGTLGNANVGWVDSNNRVDVGSWLGTAVTTSGTTAKPEVDAFSISDDATAANNAELMFDGTGYAGGTTNLQVDTVAISGDTTAADNAELAFDGTGFGFTGCTMPTTTAVTNATTVGTINDGAIAAAAVADIFSTTTIAESYAADAAAGTPAQILYQIQQALTEFAIVSTTLTVKKLDGSTTAATYTLDDATTPTSRTRAT